MGFVVADRAVLTCAHVVNTALGRSQRAQDKPADVRLIVEFPLLGGPDGGPIRTAKVEVWQPPPETGISGGDIAGLILVGEGLPTGAYPARLMAAVPSSQVQVFGTPPDVPRPGGAWAGCRFHGRVGGGRLQLDADSEAAFRAHGHLGTVDLDDQLCVPVKWD